MTWQSQRAPNSSYLVAWLVWTSLWLLPDSYVLSLKFLICFTFSEQNEHGGIHYFSKHKPTGKPEFDMLRANSWTPGGMLLISNDLLEDIGAPSWVERWEVDLFGWSEAWKITGYRSMGPRFFFFGGIRFKLDAKMLLVVFKGICPLRIVREVWFGN